MMSTETQGSAGTNEVLSPTAKMENEIRSKPKKPVMTTKQREFTFTGYDIMADTGSKPPAKKETEAEKKLRKHVECYIFSCKRLGITPSRYLCRHMNDKELVMKSHPLGPKGTRALCVSLVNNDCVESLDLRDNDIGSEGALCIAEMLEENDTITELHIGGNLIKSCGVQAFAQLLKIGRLLHTLDISGSGLEDSDAHALASLIETPIWTLSSGRNGQFRKKSYTKSQLKVLNVSHNGIGEFGGLDLGRSIAINDSLKELDISWNHIRGKGALGVAIGVKKNVSLKMLNLAWNGFANEGAVALGKSLEKNRTLKSLDISNNRIGIVGIRALIKGLKQNEGLSSLKMGHNSFPPEVALAILKGIEDSDKCVLTVLDISDIVVRTDFLDKWDEIKSKRPLPLRIVFGAVMQATAVEAKEEEIIDWRDPVMRMFKWMHDKGYRIIDLLKRLDRDRSLSVDRQELKMGLVAENIPMTEAQLDEVITKLDTNKDGEVDLGELIKGERDFRKKMKARMKKLLKSTKPDATMLKLMEIEDL